MTLSNRQQIESTLLAAVADRLGESRFNLWFGKGVHLALIGDGESLEVQVPNAFFRQWIQDHFSNSLLDAVESITGRRVQLTFAIQKEDDSTLSSLVGFDTNSPPTQKQKDHGITIPGMHNYRATPPSLGSPAEPSAIIRVPVTTVVGPSMNRSARVLNRFVIGLGNRLAHAAVCEMIRTAGGMFNPLLIHGGIGLGKTYLLEATAYGLQTLIQGLMCFG